MKLDLFCIASGPSLTKEDCALIAKTNTPILAVNNSWEISPRCDYLYAGDYKWWTAYGSRVPENIVKISSSRQAASRFKLQHHSANGPFNSGMRALIWALENGFKSIALLGFDCSLKNGTHWHGDHNTRRGLSNPDKSKVDKWHLQFLDVYEKAKRVKAEIVNCSRHTELGCFPLMDLESLLDVKPKRKRRTKKEPKK